MTTAPALVGTVILSATLLIGLALPCSAAPSPEAPVVKTAEAARIESSASPAIDAEGDAYACNRARRRLWVEGEGWVVRRVTTCR